jgi:TolB protein
MTIRISALLLLATAGTLQAQAGGPAAQPFPARADEPRLANVRQLTFGGENAEAYFSADGRKLVFQATVPGGHPCDVIFTMNTDGSEVHRVSTGTGRTTCGYFFPGRDRIVYASTHAHGDSCPPRPDYSQGYVWALYEYDLYTTDANGGDPRRLTDNPGYDAEATISPDGKTIIFTSVRDGDLELYAMDADGGNVRRLTSEVGYDGGAFFSPDGKRIVYRAHHPTEPEKVADYRRLLSQGLVRPSTLEIWVMDVDGRNKRQVTSNGAANFAPFFHPGGEKIIFSSNVHDPRGRDFDLYLVNLDGTGMERVTTFGEFDGFPMFSPDGKQLVFGSNRGARQRGDTNVFIADWVER